MTLNEVFKRAICTYGEARITFPLGPGTGHIDVKQTVIGLAKKHKIHSIPLAPEHKQRLAQYLVEKGININDCMGIFYDLR